MINDEIKEHAERVGGQRSTATQARTATTPQLRIQKTTLRFLLPRALVERTRQRVAAVWSSVDE